MFQKIKYYLFKLFLTQKKKLALFACLVFVGLFVISQTTHAFALDLANVQLDALDFIDNTVLKWLVFIALLAIESVALVNISADLLDWSSALPVNLGNPLNPNPLVDAGWHFTSGLANLAFILIFIVIVLAYILKFDNFKMKQALPRLIIIALLINFSLLFVKMLSDIGWIFQNSFSSAFFKEGSGFATAAASALTASTKSLLGVIIGIPVAYLAVAWIPYVNVIALTAIAVLVLGTGGAGGIVGGALIGTISQTIMVIVLNFTIGFIFLVFAALFLVRIAAIWLLAIFAPLAFMAFILPNTKKYFDQWMKALIQWIFLGVVVYFLLGLGLMLFGLVAPGSGQTPLFGDLGKFSDIFYKYIFLVIYMIVVLVASKKLVPTGVQAIWSAVEKGTMAAGGVAFGAGLKGIAGPIKSVTTYQQARKMGFTRRQALGEAGTEIKRWIKPKQPGAMREATWGETAKAAPKAAFKGILNAVKGVTVAGGTAAFGIKLPKKKGFRPNGCPACGNKKVAASAKQCPTCQYSFE